MAGETEGASHCEMPCEKAVGEANLVIGQLDVNPRKKPYVPELEKLLRWFKKMNMNQYINVER